MPSSVRCCCGPMPDSISNCGELTAPPQRMTSRPVNNPAILPECDPGGATPFEDDLFGQRLGHDLQIWALHRRAQIADRGRAAPALARRRLVVADAVLACAIEIAIAREPKLH